MADREAEKDIVLIQRILSGDSEAFRPLAERYSGPLLGFCLGRLGNEEEARDMVQEVLFRAYRSLGTFKLGFSFKTWLFTIAVNKVKVRWAKRSSEQALMEGIRAEASVMNPEGKGRDAESEAMERLDAERVRKAISGLGGANRRAAELYYLAELSVEETASVLKLGTEAVKSRLFRARKELATALADATETGRKG